MIMTTHRQAGVACFSSLALLATAFSVHADGGTLRLSQRRGPYRVTVFTAPTHLRAGPVDISVLVQDADSSKPLLDVPVEVRVRSVDVPETAMGGLASVEAATNKLFRALQLDLAPAGRWRVEVTAGGTETAGFEMELGEALPSWLGLAGWIAWPVLVIFLFAVHAWLARKPSGVKPVEHVATS
jgi:hypothetical protein